MLKWIAYMATEGFGNLKYNVKFKLEISSAMRGETLNSSLDHSSDPPCIRQAEGSLGVPEKQKSQGCPSPSCCHQCGVLQGHTSLPNIYLLKTLLLKTSAATIEEEQK